MTVRRSRGIGESIEPHVTSNAAIAVLPKVVPTVNIAAVVTRPSSRPRVRNANAAFSPQGDADKAIPPVMATRRIARPGAPRASAAVTATEEKAMATVGADR
jgi:hypothetical protein